MKKIIYIILIIFVFAFQFSFVKADKVNLDTTYDNMSTATYSCGNKMITGIPKGVVTTVHIAYIVLQISVPVILVVIGTIDFIKAMIAQKEDEMKKAQMLFVKRLIYAAIIFFVFVIVKLVVGVVSDNANVMNCADCFLNENCSK